MADITVSTTIDNFMQAADADAAKAILNIGAGGSGGTVQGTDGTYDIRATNEGVIAGNVRGENSVDLQTIRAEATQVASGIRTVIGGGYNNTAENQSSTVAGGESNVAADFASFVGGGNSNTASAYVSTIVAGQDNTTSGYYSFIGAGRDNTISGYYSAILGGHDNNDGGFTKAMIVGTGITATDVNTLHCNNLKIEDGGFKLPTGATNNYVLTTDANGVGTWQAAPAAGSGGQVDSVVGGTNITIDNTDPINPIINAAGGPGGGGGTVQGTDGTYDVKVVASDDFVTPDARGENSIDLQTKRAAATQVASEQFSSILGGRNNTSSGYGSTVINGRQNSATTNYATVLNGNDNTVSGDYSIVGGYGNTVSGYYSSCVGGYNNTVSSHYACVVGGYGNTNSGYISSMLGGYNNTISIAASQSTLGGGYNNTIESPDSFIGGGIDNTAPTGLDAVMIVGSGITADRSNCTFVNNLSIMDIPTVATGLPAGSVWNDGGTLKIV